MDIHEVKNLIEQGNVNIVDVRDPQSYEEAHIKGAILITPETLENFIRDADKEKPLVCYCYHGISSLNAKSFFEENGFKTVNSMDGGFEEWRTAYPFVAGAD